MVDFSTLPNGDTGNNLLQCGHTEGCIIYCEFDYDDFFDVNNIYIYPEPYDVEITFDSVKQALENSIDFAVHHFDDYETFNFETFCSFEIEDGTNYELSSIDLDILKSGNRTILFAL